MVRKPKKQKVAQSLKLDLGCGQVKREGFIGVDIAKCNNVDIVHDLTKFPWPFKDASVEEIHCSHFLEHLTAPQRIRFMEECYRVLQPQGKLGIIVPHGVSERFYQDPTHQWPPIVPATFLYFNRTWVSQNKLEHQHSYNCDFDFGYGYNMDPVIAGKHEEARAFAIKHYFNACTDLVVNLVKR